MNTTKPTLSIDVEYYQHYLDGTDLTDTQKRELLETLWSVVCEFVMMGYGVHPLQRFAPENDGQVPETDNYKGFLTESMVACHEQLLRKEGDSA